MSPAGSKNAPEAKAREKIDRLLAEAGWLVQDRDDMNLTAGDAIAEQAHRARRFEDSQKKLPRDSELVKALAEYFHEHFTPRSGERYDARQKSPEGGDGDPV